MNFELADKITEYVANEFISPVFDSDKDLWLYMIGDPFNKFVNFVYSNITEKEEKDLLKGD